MEINPVKKEKSHTDSSPKSVVQPKFAIIGLGFISDKHLDAIEDVNGVVVAGCDIDEEKRQKLPEGCRFFPKWERMMNDSIFREVDYVSICTPNYLHFPMAVAARERGKKVICEKPLVIRSEHIHHLDDKVYSVLQLRYSPILNTIRNNLSDSNMVEMNISVHRGDWYFDSWKNDDEKSGGLCMNIGIHYFDLLTSLFGHLSVKDVFVGMPGKEIGGVFHTEDNFITWKLSLLAKKDNQCRSITVNNIKYDLSRRFDNLHTKVYEDVVFNDNGVTPNMVYKSLRLVEMINMKLKLVEFA
jgi:UDP-N-acetyl-2-amino-2-deoxyglucuronate dehydrogenase